MNALIEQQLQNLGAGDEYALALKEYHGIILTNFPYALVAGRYGLKKTISQGKTHQFPARSMMNAEEHTPGTELPGNDEPLSEERLVTVDDKELVAHNWGSTVQEFVAHFDTRQSDALEAVAAIARQYDSRWLRCLILGARQSARGPASEFPGGTKVTRSGATIAAAYPVSLAGSKALQDNLAEMAQTMDEKNVPQDGRVAMITPYLNRVLLQDKTLTSEDYQDPNDLLTRQVYKVEGFLIEKTNLMPNTNVTTGESTYRGDFTKTVAGCYGHPSAVGTVEFVGIVPFGPEWVLSKRAWLTGAALLQGSKWLRPEACGEIEISGS